MRCKVGDLAVIVKSGFPENLCRFVWVRSAVPQEDWINKSVPEWSCESAGSPLRFESSDKSGTGVDMQIDFFDHALRPIRPSADPESTTREKEIEYE